MGRCIHAGTGQGSARGRGSFVKGSDFIAVPSPPETSVKHSLATLGISSVK